MTSDAKIGLLLGLVFIFVIAFIINGLPTLKPPTNKPERTTTMVSVPNVGVAGQTQRAQDEMDWIAMAEQETAVEAARPAEIPQRAEPSHPVAHEAQLQRAQPQTTDDPDVRSVYLIPSHDLVNRFVESIQRASSTMVSLDVPGPSIQPVAEVARSAPDARPNAMTTRAPEAREPVKPANQLNTVVGKIYVVQEGDNLSSIAKKAYGPEEGNRLVNSDRIYEANKETLKSKDEVRVGQTLIIPPLPKAPASTPTPTPANSLPKELFERVEALGRPIQPVASASPTPDLTNWKGQWYVVQEGDALWRIASAQLGAGARCEEIRKLNVDLLKNGDKLDLGMKLRLPPK